jgi:hypothetical protein
MSNRRQQVVWLTLLSLFVWPSSFVRADGGTLRLWERAGGYQIAVFTAPTPLRAGPVDVSVLVQDGTSGEPIPEVRVTIHLRQDDESLAYPATGEAATNKLFRAAQLDLPRPGRWAARIAVEGPCGSAEVGCELEAGDPLPPGLQLAPWIGWPALVVVLFGVHQVLVRRRQRPSDAIR